MKQATITVDSSEVQEAEREIKMLLSPGSLDRVPNGFIESLTSLLDSGLPGCIEADNITAPETGNLIIRLRVSGELKELAATARALNLDFNSCHGSPLAA